MNPPSQPVGAAARPAAAHAGANMLLALLDQQAFDPLPLRAGLHLVHVPFDELTATTTTEAALTRAVRAGSRVAVTGPSGAGKSSMIGFALTEILDEVAVLRVPVEAEDPATVREPGAFAAHMLGELARQADRAGRLTKRERDTALRAAARTATTERGRVTKAGFGLPPWLLHADVATESHSILTAPIQRSAASTIESLTQLMNLLAARGLQPVVLIDDSDAWLETPAGDRRDLIAPFFGRVLRDVAEELVCGWVVAVHDHYLTRPDFPHANGILQTQVAVPRLPAIAALDRILEARIRAALLGSDKPAPPLAAVFTADAVDALFAAYLRGAYNVRIPVHLAHAALEAACDDDAAVITTAHVQVAQTRFQPLP